MQGAEWKAKQRLKAAKLKDKQAQGETLTARAFKAEHCNKAAQSAARSQVSVRTNIGKGGTHATKKDKDRLRTQWHGGKPNPGNLWKPDNLGVSGALSLTSARRHIVTSL